MRKAHTGKLSKVQKTEKKTAVSNRLAMYSCTASTVYIIHVDKLIELTKREISGLIERLHLLWYCVHGFV